jgi:glutathione S-transferase
MVYLGKSASELDPEKVKRGYAALEHMERHLRQSRFMVGDAVSLADVALLAYTRVADEGSLELDRIDIDGAIRRWIGDTEKNLGLIFDR